MSLLYLLGKYFLLWLNDEVANFAVTAALWCFNMALAEVCGFDYGSTKSKLSFGFSEGFGQPSAIDALAASQSFTVPQGINVCHYTFVIV